MQSKIKIEYKEDDNLGWTTVEVIEVPWSIARKIGSRRKAIFCKQFGIRTNIKPIYNKFDYISPYWYKPEENQWAVQPESLRLLTTLERLFYL